MRFVESTLNENVNHIVDFLSVPIGKVMETGSRCWGGTRNWGEIENCYPWLM